MADLQIVEDRFVSQSIEEPSNNIEDSKEHVEAHVNEIGSLEKWNSPTINIYRYLAALFSFIILGMNDAAFGVCLPQPQLQGHYDRIITDFPQGFDSICMYTEIPRVAFQD